MNADGPYSPVWPAWLTEARLAAGRTRISRDGIRLNRCTRHRAWMPADTANFCICDREATGLSSRCRPCVTASTRASKRKQRNDEPMATVEKNTACPVLCRVRGKCTGRCRVSAGVAA